MLEREFVCVLRRRMLGEKERMFHPFIIILPAMPILRTVLNYSTTGSCYRVTILHHMYCSWGVLWNARTCSPYNMIIVASTIDKSFIFCGFLGQDYIFFFQLFEISKQISCAFHSVYDFEIHSCSHFA